MWLQGPYYNSYQDQEHGITFFFIHSLVLSSTEIQIIKVFIWIFYNFWMQMNLFVILSLLFNHFSIYLSFAKIDKNVRPPWKYISPYSNRQTQYCNLFLCVYVMMFPLNGFSYWTLLSYFLISVLGQLFIIFLSQNLHSEKCLKNSF